LEEIKDKYRANRAVSNRPGPNRQAYDQSEACDAIRTLKNF